MSGQSTANVVGVMGYTHKLDTKVRTNVL